MSRLSDLSTKAFKTNGINLLKSIVLGKLSLGFNI